MRILTTIVIAPLIAWGADAPSANAELSQLKRVCASFVGKQALSSQWDQLRPFLRDRHALDAPEAYCGMTCTGSVALRGGYQLEYVYVNPPHLGLWKPGEAIVQSVTLRSDEKQLFHRELAPK
jgi:hypothetical protein